MIHFTKMEGIGNDYIYADAIHQNIPLDATFIRKISDRHFGIGSDGLIVILPSRLADFKMRIFNADGSEAKMCGNGIRCFAKFCYDHHLTDQKVMRIETLSGIKTVRLLFDGEKPTGAQVSMGPATFIDGGLEHNTIVNGVTYTYHLVSMGNPHAVVFCDDLGLNVNEVGEIISRDTNVAGGVNVEFVHIINKKEIAVRVYERGSQETMACGTGACASVIESLRQHLTESQVTVHLLGGDLKIICLDKDILMEGPATTVFEGEIKEV